VVLVSELVDARLVMVFPVQPLWKKRCRSEGIGEVALRPFFGADRLDEAFWS
jgi:hypothetical protein